MHAVCEQKTARSTQDTPLHEAQCSPDARELSEWQRKMEAQLSMSLEELEAAVEEMAAEERQKRTRLSSSEARHGCGTQELPHQSVPFLATVSSPPMQRPTRSRPSSGHSTARRREAATLHLQGTPSPPDPRRHSLPQDDGSPSPSPSSGNVSELLRRIRRIEAAINRSERGAHVAPFTFTAEANPRTQVGGQGRER
jgi:hypothetical protein